MVSRRAICPATSEPTSLSVYCLHTQTDPLLSPSPFRYARFVFGALIRLFLVVLTCHVCTPRTPVETTGKRHARSRLVT